MTEQTKTIDGIEFHVDYLMVGEARPALVRLTKKLAPAVGAVGDLLATVKGGSLNVGDLDTGDIGPALVAAMEGLDDKDLEYFCAIFGKATTYRLPGESATPYLTTEAQGTLFRGKLLLMFKWLVFAVQVNYADFFAGLPSLVSAPRVSPEKASV